MSSGKRGTALVEFALAWPIALLLALGTVETAVWTSEMFAARSAALAGARAAAAGGTPEVAVAVTKRVLAPSLVGVSVSTWCPGESQPSPALWVCARDQGDAIELEISGAVPAIVPLVSQAGLPLHAHVVVQKERFAK